MTQATPTPAIRLQGVGFRWPSASHETLSLEAMEITQGERVFIEGPSGCGKSTLLSLLTGVNRPDRGELEVLGCAIGGLSGGARDRFRADHIGVIFQMFNLIPYLSMVENVTLPCRFSRKRRERAEAGGKNLEQEALRLLEHLDLHDPQLLHRPVHELSVGQQQRVAAARALIGAPEILIADEPTSSLDTQRRTAFIELLEGECRAQGGTLLFVSHDPSLEACFDRTIRLPEINLAAADR
jgi:putative ABC transport system ATP-binding protein